MIDLTQFRFGNRYRIDGKGAIVVLESYSRMNDGQHTAWVTFACDWRRTQFPFDLERLKPVTEDQTVH